MESETPKQELFRITSGVVLVVLAIYLLKISYKIYKGND